QQLKEGRTAHGNSGARGQPPREGGRTHSGSRRGPRRGGRPSGQGDRRPARVGRTDPRGGGRGMMAVPSILVVEDEPAIMELLRVNLADAGYDVRVAPDAESAQRDIARSPPSLVLLDWMLPGKSGLVLAKELRSDART